MKISEEVCEETARAERLIIQKNQDNPQKSNRALERLLIQIETSTGIILSMVLLQEKNLLLHMQID